MIKSLVAQALGAKPSPTEPIPHKTNVTINHVGDDDPTMWGINAILDALVVLIERYPQEVQDGIGRLVRAGFERRMHKYASQDDASISLVESNHDVFRG